jgi:ribosome biogenesis GTPase
VELANGTRLIDTPGCASSASPVSTGAALASYFPELAGPAERCRFRDCSHLVEPDCAVRAAVEAGAIPARRFEATDGSTGPWK